MKMRRRRVLRLAGLALGATGSALILLYALPGVSPHAAPTPLAHVARAQPLPNRPPALLPIRSWLAIGAHAPMRRIPSSFLGISTEYWGLPLWASHLSLLERTLSLVRGPGRLVLRIGGDSADRTFWSPMRELPDWAFELTPAWLREVRAIVRHTGARLILDLNLVTATPAIAARWARVAEAMLPRHSIIGFEIGNEPDLYSHSLWQAALAAGPAARLLPQQLTAGSYTAAFAAYASALSSAAPGVPLLGPALAEPAINVSWVSRLLAAPHPGLNAITVHRYPYSACVPPSASSYPTIARVLSRKATAGMARTVLGPVRAAHEAGLPLRLSELNSVTCGGTKGVSNTFATALWAPDALFELLHAGVDAVGVHVRARAINSAFALRPRGLVAHPLLYGIVMFNRMLGPDPQLVSLHLRARPELHLKAWAVRSGHGILRVLVINESHAATAVKLSLPTHGSAAVQRLLAPSVRDTRGVTLGGQWLGANGRWRGHRAIGAIAPGPHGYVLTISGYSAALLTAHLRAGALQGRP